MNVLIRISAAGIILALVGLAATEFPRILEDIILPEVKSEGESATFNCTVLHQQTSTVKWYYYQSYGPELSEIISENDVIVSGTLGCGNGNEKYEIVRSVSGEQVLYTLTVNCLVLTDNGGYRCQVQIPGVTVYDWPERVGYLTVYAAPRFTYQPEGPFYIWVGDTENYLPCVVTANPMPAFKWYKNNNEITEAYPFFSITFDVNTKNFTTTSKLWVLYNGQNDESVFGDFVCRASNTVDNRSMVITMLKGSPEPHTTDRLVITETTTSVTALSEALSTSSQTRIGNSNSSLIVSTSSSTTRSNTSTMPQVTDESTEGTQACRGTNCLPPRTTAKTTGASAIVMSVTLLITITTLPLLLV